MALKSKQIARFLFQRSILGTYEVIQTGTTASKNVALSLLAGENITLR